MSLEKYEDVDVKIELFSGEIIYVHANFPEFTEDDDGVDMWEMEITPLRNYHWPFDTSVIIILEKHIKSIELLK